MSAHAGTLLGLVAMARYVVFAVNYEILCSNGECAVLPNVSEVSNYEHGRLGQLRFAAACLATFGQDIASWFILTAAYQAMYPGPLMVAPTIFEGILGTCLVLDVLQVITVTFKYHWVLIQTSGVFMFAAMILLLVALMKAFPNRQDGCMTWLAALLLFTLGLCGLALLVLFAAQFPLGHEMWCLLEYLALFLSTCYQMALGSLLPSSRVTLGTFPRLLKVHMEKAALPLLRSGERFAEI